MTGTSETVLVPIRLDTLVRLQRLVQPGDHELDEVIRRLIERETKRNDGPPAKPKPAGSARHRLVVLGEIHELASLGEVVATAVDVLGTRDPRLFDRARELVGNRRRYLAERPEALYPGRPDLARDHARRCRCGWWVPTNIGRRDACRILERFCEILGLAWGRDVRLESGERSDGGSGRARRGPRPDGDRTSPFL